MIENIVNLDFEYSESKDRTSKRLVAVVLKDGENIPEEYDLTIPSIRETFIDRVKNLSLVESTVFGCYSLDAEFNSLLHLGINTYDNKWIDWAVEARMLCMTNSKTYLPQGSLLKHCARLGITHRYAEQKNEMRDLILDNLTYTDQEMSKILDYCKADVEALYDLQNVLMMLDTKIAFKDRVIRADYAKAASLALFNTKGLPVDVAFLDTIANNKQSILNGLYKQVNAEADLNIFLLQPDGRYVRKLDAFSEYLDNIGLKESWNRTPKGKISTSEETFEKFLSRFKDHPTLGLVYNTIQTKKSLNSTDYRSLMSVEGYVKPLSIPFNQVSSRTSPKPAQGFALNLQPWLRRMIVPKPNMCLITADWAKQEMLVAASLSGDENFMADVQSDIYVETGKMVGLIPPEGDKNSHASVRQGMKAIVLGVGYGKQEDSVAIDFEVIFKMTVKEAKSMAKKLFKARSKRYKKYYKWLVKMEDKARQKGRYITLDNWVYYVGRRTRSTQLKNLPMQSTGAAILRRSVILAVEAGLDLVCSLHDALYINSTMDDREVNSELLLKVMAQAVADIMGDDLIIDNDLDVYLEGERYYDPRGRDIKTLQSLGEIVPDFLKFI